ncbi:dolichyl-diphosphooligosaccharide--protein glycosyltransferase 48 kDa subunit-like [Camellia sinensis]|uniref:Dolichyl-diphosphooligosaccharide--protein glycosyltransferase 48 kDa subunit n=1 Tax=Camellia sinensis var. sinensis TaxID=542762 RepID=A0A4S4DJ81_CAMSN|nr:dolichyl-diphosphooligosaccharide--protein glycosyltransferase 48 kDa subunit-like [Camellia sinensis]THG02900.1 hypothetical protein TEA_007621 [Camellia sinensis var. sinensis]
MSTLQLIFLTAIPFLATLCSSFSPEHPTDPRILVLLDDLAIRSSHSIFLNSLQSRGFDLDFKLADDPKISLHRYSQYLYDGLILFSPTVERFGGSIDLAAIMDFVDAGHDLIMGANSSASNLIREIATECGVDFDEDPGAMVIDHISYAVSDTDGNLTLIASAEFIQSEVLWGSKKIEAPVLLWGIGHSSNTTIMCWVSWMVIVLLSLRLDWIWCISFEHCGVSLESKTTI